MLNHAQRHYSAATGISTGSPIKHARRASWEGPNSPQCNAENAVLLIRAAYDARAGIFKAHNKIPDIGYSVLLLVLFWHLRLTLPDEQLLFFGAIIEAIAIDVSPPYTPPVDAANADGLANALLRQLSFRESNGIPIKMRYIEVLTEYTHAAIERSGLFHLYAPTFVAAFDRLTYELDRSCQEGDGECWQNTLIYFSLLAQNLQTSTVLLSSDPPAEGPPPSDVLALLLQVDFISISARLLLLPSAMIVDADSNSTWKTPQGKPDSKAAYDTTLHSIMTLLVSLHKFKKLAHTTFEHNTLDWRKTYNYILQLHSMSLPPTHPLQPYLKDLENVWKRVGNYFGCWLDLETLPCAYRRCAAQQKPTRLLSALERSGVEERQEIRYAIRSPPEHVICSQEHSGALMTTRP
ncbi:hypothetical protein BDV93DRAFT_591905, partial [Ceratobasidium sp. AG-I]